MKKENLTDSKAMELNAVLPEVKLGGLLISKGTQFVQHYPSMFTEDTEWWAQKLDEHFNEEKGRLYVIKYINSCIDHHDKLMKENASNLDFYYADKHKTLRDKYIGDKCQMEADFRNK